MKNKAFTLTELIAVIVIIGLILLTAVPAVYKLLTDNKNEKYEYYYKTVQEASEVYARANKDTLGNSLATGCTTTTVTKLVDEGFLKAYNKDDETVIDSQIIINNNYGKFSFDIYLKIGKGSTISYEKGEKKSTTSCTSYDPGLNSSLVAKLKNKYDTDGYITSNDNYVYYSGKLWRAIWLDKTKEQVKLVTDEIVGIIPFGSNNQFKNSYIEHWLNEYFLNSLYNPNKYLSNFNWGNSSTKKVGLISTTDIDKITYLSATPYNWTLTANGSDNVYLNDKSSKSYSSSYGVKPTIMLKSGIKAVVGTGTLSKPYQLEGNKIEAQANKKLNTRYSGEYVKINNDLYRIVNVIDNRTKLITAKEEDICDYKEFDEIYDEQSKTYKGLEINSFSELVTKGDWYLGDSSTSINYVLGNVNTNIKTFEVGVPMYGEIVYFTKKDIRNAFWTLTSISGEDNKMIGINPSGEINTINDKDMEAVCIKYLLYIKDEVTIIKGSGTESDPFVIKEAAE